MYNLLKKCLFSFSPETSHYLALKSLSVMSQLGVSHFLPKPIHQPQTIMGIHFPNPIGLAAGLDKNADYIDALASVGFGFIEVGTLTPKPQAGNPKPRLFRLVPEEAIINRMGFNNKGVEYAADRLSRIKYKGILGINIGKNKDTPNEKAVDDYVFGFRKLGKFASYITVNVSSPNTNGLRDLQQAQALMQLLSALKEEQQHFLTQSGRYVPLVVKISPDVSNEMLGEMADVFLQCKMDGVIATNTSVDRAAVSHSPFAAEAGGLSGAPLRSKSSDIIRGLYQLLGSEIPVIASGGVTNANDVKEKLACGAKLVQVYSGFIYNGWNVFK
jgi:dihydroorotate dehydrogenase